MQFLNSATGKVYNHLTARQIALYVVEGVDVRATASEWKRINRRIRQMGLLNHGHVTIDTITSMAIDIVIEESNLYHEVDLFLEEMYIMGMLEEPDDDDDE